MFTSADVMAVVATTDLEPARVLRGRARAARHRGRRPRLAFDAHGVIGVRELTLKRRDVALGAGLPRDGDPHRRDPGPPRDCQARPRSYPGTVIDRHASLDRRHADGLRRPIYTRTRHRIARSAGRSARQAPPRDMFDRTGTS